MIELSKSVQNYCFFLTYASKKEKKDARRCLFFRFHLFSFIRFPVFCTHVLNKQIDEVFGNKRIANGMSCFVRHRGLSVSPGLRLLRFRHLFFPEINLSAEFGGCMAVEEIIARRRRLDYIRREEGSQHTGSNDDRIQSRISHSERISQSSNNERELSSLDIYFFNII